MFLFTFDKKEIDFVISALTEGDIRRCDRSKNILIHYEFEFVRKNTQIRKIKSNVRQ
ncbi:MAG: hypothetical protein OHK0057_17880 [Thermoflexibacter sp.]